MMIRKLEQRTKSVRKRKEMNDMKSMNNDGTKKVRYVYLFIEYHMNDDGSLGDGECVKQIIKYGDIMRDDDLLDEFSNLCEKIKSKNTTEERTSRNHKPFITYLELDLQKQEYDDNEEDYVTIEETGLEGKYIQGSTYPVDSNPNIPYDYAYVYAYGIQRGYDKETGYFEEEEMVDILNDKGEQITYNRNPYTQEELVRMFKEKLKEIRANEPENTNLVLAQWVIPYRLESDIDLDDDVEYYREDILDAKYF